MPSGGSRADRVEEMVSAPTIAGLPLPEALNRIASSAIESQDVRARLARIFEVEVPGGRGEFTDAPMGMAASELLGLAHEALRAHDERRPSGSFYTPSDVVAGVLDLCWPSTQPATVCDPAVGGGVFLLMAAERLRVEGVAPTEIVTERLFGADLDPLAVAVARAALLLWSLESGGAPAECPNLVVGDPIDGLRATWAAADDGFDLVVGNPPYLGQLRRSTARTAKQLARMREVLGPSVGPYTDSAVLFLLAGRRLAADGGRLAMLSPESALTARDAAPARHELLDHAEMEAMWVADEMVFDADVRVCAPVLSIGTGRATGDRSGVLSVRSGRRFERSVDVGEHRLRDAPTWGLVLAVVRGVPIPDLDLSHRLGEWCQATAGFRDEYYGIVPFVVEEAEARSMLGEGSGLDESMWPRLVTSGLVDPAAMSWGSRPCRFAKRAWHRPRIDLRALGAADPGLHKWAVDRLVPKIVVATQTRVVEAVVDDGGNWFPSTPTISVEPDSAPLWDIAAVLSAPAVSAWAMFTYCGGALSGDAVKLAASQVLDIPLPVDRDAFGDAVAKFRAASKVSDPVTRLESLHTFGSAMEVAYGVTAEVTDWWLGRLPQQAETQDSASSSH